MAGNFSIFHSSIVGESTMGMNEIGRSSLCGSPMVLAKSTCTAVLADVLHMGVNR